MPKPLRTQFVIADGSRARWVERSKQADDFVTVKDLTHTAQRTGGPQGAVFESSSGRRFSVEEGDAAVRQRRNRFAQDIADVINAEESGFDRLALIAPARVLTPIVQRLSGAAGAKLSKTLAKDLTKTPDHELGTWLRRLEMG